ncbi:MAG: serine/threonine protein kinase [Planctomycetota bacterium]|nr:MAG: serine/threonine protein kinase [Planctomycetota bacterium]
MNWRRDTAVEQGPEDASERSLGGYRLLAPLGRGSNAVVYLARKPGIERRFALKLLPAGRDGEAHARFLREARVAARLDHPGLVPVIDVGEDRGRCYLVMEYVPGPSLAELLRRRGRLPWKEAAELVAGLAEAVGVAHAAGVVHRDLKPANVLIDERDGVARITDFGLAREGEENSELTRSGDVLGTPYYMAPEQVRGRTSDARADVYALGVILYEAISGERPYRTGSIDELVPQVLAGRYEPLRRKVPDLDPALEAVCARALHVDRLRRYPDGGALATALRDAVAGISGTRVAGVRRGGLGAPHALAVLMAALAVGAIAWGFGQRAEATRLRAALEERAERARAEAREAAERVRELAQERAALEERLQAARGQAAEASALRARLLDLEREAQRDAGGSLQPRGVLKATLERAAESLRGGKGAERLRFRLLVQLGRYAEAREALEAVRRANPEDLDADIEAYALPSDDAAQGREALRHLIARAPESAHAAVARLFLSPSSPGELASALERVTREQPSAAWAWVFLCRSLNAEGLRGRNVEAFRAGIRAGDRALDLEPANPFARYARSACRYHLWLQTRDPSLQEPILEDLRWAREVLPSPEYWTDAGKSLVLFGRPREARGELQEAVRRARGPERARALAWLGAALFDLGDEVAARGQWLTAIDTAPESRATYDFLGHLVRASAETRRAVLAAAPPGVRSEIERTLRAGGR